mgnify:CR=1 FL=1
MKANFIGPAGAARGPNDRVIVSAGIGEHYAPDFAATRARCNQHCSDVWRLYYDDYPDGCPPQIERQYAFKVFAIEQAIRAGFRYILWMDAAFAPIAAIDRLWETIASKGWYVPPQYAYTLGRWCSDAALEIFGIHRARADTIPLVFTGLVGLDMQNPIGWAIWDWWERLYEAGAFDGPHFNRPGEPITPCGPVKLQGHASDDPTVGGHRHDESSLSYVLHVLGLKPMMLNYLTLESKAGFIGHLVRLAN